MITITLIKHSGFYIVDIIYSVHNIDSLKGIYYE
ncbi:hypothetical protein [Pseudomonas phage ANB1]|nr:hypothetical protein [Pseudomonas phage ANB1]